MKHSTKIGFTVVDKFIPPPPPEFDLSKKLILVKAPPKGTCPRNLCEIPGGGNKFVDHGKEFSLLNSLRKGPLFPYKILKVNLLTKFLKKGPTVS